MAKSLIYPALKWLLSIVMLVYQRVNRKKKGMTDHAPNQKIDPAFNSQARTDNLGDG